MADIRVSMRVLFANGQPAANLPAQVTEVGVRTYDIGKTRADGGIDTVLRQRRKIRFLGLEFDDPTDNPRLLVVLSDPAGHQAQTPPVPTFVLPPAFDPSACARQALGPLVDANAPGCVFLVRKNGTEWANATHGLARVAPAQDMSNDTIVHLASMSKPITATALVAMIDDWTAMRDAIAALGSSAEPTQILRLGPVEIAVPTVLVPLFSDPARAAPLLKGTWLSHVHPKVLYALDQFAHHGATVSPRPTAPAGYFGLLRRVIDQIAVPDYADPFLPLIKARLGGDGATIGTGVAAITLADLLTHHTDLDDRALNPALHTAAEIAAVATQQPNGGLAQFDYWGFVKLLLAEPGNRLPNINYGNHNYTVLTTVIEACTETSFNEYVTQRLFFDARFSRLRRRVTDPALGALYYGGTSPNWTGGLQFCDYSNWPGNGGFYATANQLTDWLHVLYVRAPVARIGGGTAPLISAAGFSKLFDTTGYFSLGIVNRAGPADAAKRYQHNGGTGWNGASVNGNMAIIVTPSQTVYTALFVANGNIGADPPFESAVSSLPWA
jgi:CubicO group peptidase (beta-lactamase class C family)